MELLPVYIALSLFILATIIATIFILVDRNFLRFESVGDFAKLDEYLYCAEENDLHSDIIEQYQATYSYNDNLIQLHAVIFKSKLCASRYFNKYSIFDGFAICAAKSFTVSKNKKTRARLYKNTFLLVEGERSPDFDEFYKLVLACLKTKSKR